MPFPELQSFWKSRIIAFFSLYEFSLFTYLCFVRAILSYWYGERKMDIWIGKEKYTDWNLEGFFCPLPSLIPPTLMVSSGFIFPLCMFSLFLSLLSSCITNMEKLRRWLIFESIRKKCEELWNGSEWLLGIFSRKLCVEGFALFTVFELFSSSLSCR